MHMHAHACRQVPELIRGQAVQQMDALARSMLKQVGPQEPAATQEAPAPRAHDAQAPPPLHVHCVEQQPPQSQAGQQQHQHQQQGGQQPCPHPQQEQQRPLGQQETQQPGQPGQGTQPPAQQLPPQPQQPQAGLGGGGAALGCRPGLHQDPQALLTRAGTGSSAPHTHFVLYPPPPPPSPPPHQAAPAPAGEAGVQAAVACSAQFWEAHGAGLPHTSSHAGRPRHASGAAGVPEEPQGPPPPSDPCCGCASRGPQQDAATPGGPGSPGRFPSWAPAGAAAACAEPHAAGAAASGRRCNGALQEAAALLVRAVCASVAGTAAGTGAAQGCEQGAGGLAHDSEAGVLGKQAVSPQQHYNPTPLLPPGALLYDHLAAWLPGVAMPQGEALVPSGTGAAPPTACGLPQQDLQLLRQWGVHAALGCVAGGLLHARLVRGELQAAALECCLCAALQRAGDAAAAAPCSGSSSSGSGRGSAQPPGMHSSSLAACTAPCARTQQHACSQQPALHDVEALVTPRHLAPPGSCPAAPPGLLDPTPCTAAPTLERDTTPPACPPVPLADPRLPQQPQTQSPLLPCSARAAGGGSLHAHAQRTLFWLCLALFEQHAGHCRRTRVWEPSGAAAAASPGRGWSTSGAGPRRDAGGEGNASLGCTAGSADCAASGAGVDGRMGEAAAARCARDGGEEAVTTFMPLLAQLMHCARTHPDLQLLHCLRTAVQRATFSSIGLDF